MGPPRDKFIQLGDRNPIQKFTLTEILIELDPILYCMREISFFYRHTNVVKKHA
jgi:hypothetical protein